MIAVSPKRIPFRRPSVSHETKTLLGDPQICIPHDDDDNDDGDDDDDDDDL